MEEKIFIKNAKGFKLASIINRPDKNRKYPAIILLHGFTGYKEEAHLQELAKTLAQNGFVAIRFDCSGSGESDGTLEKDYLMSNYLEDIECVYSYLRNYEFVDKNNIGIAGHSMGAMLSIIFASAHPEIKACVGISPLTTMILGNGIKAALERWQELGWLYRQLSNNGKHIKIPFSFIQDAEKFNVLDFVGELHCPLAVVIGLADDVVDPDNSRKIFEAANERKEWIEIEKVGHDYEKYPELIKIVNDKILDFIKRYL
jgi:uncharacterized protein